MTEKTFVAVISAMPMLASTTKPTQDGGLGWDGQKLSDIIKDHLDIALPQFVSDHTWDFAMKEGSTTSIADTGYYKLPGNNNDALAVASILYGDDEVRLTKKTKDDIEDILTRRTISSVKYWAIYPRVDRSPRIRIISTPETSGETIKYFYWRNNVSLSEIPAVCVEALKLCVVKSIIPSYTKAYENALGSAINSYEQPDGEVDTVKLDSEVLKNNNRRAFLHGYF